MEQISYDRYPRFEQLTSWLTAFADEHPQLVDLSSIGRSYEGRDIHLITITNTGTGPHDEKPALWIDGNIHASEVTASMALVHLIEFLCTGYGTNERVTRALDTRTFYLVPRVNPDGAELALAELPTIVRANTRPWPIAEQLDGLIPGDIDHDGRLLQMRIEDPNGAFKPYPPDPRLMIAREPDEDGPGPYYRLLAEGDIQGFDGVTIKAAMNIAGVDSNRNFPYKWEPSPNVGPGGSGDFPGSEPEVAAMLHAISERRNICGYFAYHTFSGVLLRPYADQPDDTLPADDLWTYQALGERATELTGYPAISTFHDFRYHPQSFIVGVGTDWAYDHLGIYSWTTEFWNVLAAAGIDAANPLEWYRVHSLDDELKLLAWIDENVPGGYVDWYGFDHPQLGKVELGGWYVAGVFRNPPPPLLEAEISPHSELALFQALCSPLLVHRDTIVEHIEEGVWRVRVVVDNAGWLSTNVTQRALDRKVVQPIVARISLPDGATLVTGTERIALGQLTGRALNSHGVRQFAGSDDTTDRTVAEWLIAAPSGTRVDVTVQHDRAGVVRQSIDLR